MEFYVSSSSRKKPYDLHDVLEDFKRNGIKNVELGSSHSYVKDMPSLINNCAKHMNFVMHNYFPPHEDPFALNLSALDDDIRAKSIKHAKDSIDLCVEIGSRIYSIHAGMLKNPSKIEFFEGFTFDKDKENGNYEQAFKLLVESCIDINLYAYERGVKFTIENSGGHPNKYQYLMMTREHEFEKLFSCVNHENFGVLLDLGHFNLSHFVYPDENIESFITKFSSKIYQVHIHHNDGTNDQHLPPTNVELCLVKKIYELNPKAILTLESMENDMAGIIQSLKELELGV